MKTLRLTRAESAAYAAGERCFWRAMRKQPEGHGTLYPDQPWWFVGGYRTRAGASNPLRCPYGTPRDRILISTSKDMSHLHHITAITVTQRGGKWGWLVEVGV